MHFTPLGDTGGHPGLQLLEGSPWTAASVSKSAYNFCCSIPPPPPPGAWQVTWTHPSPATGPIPRQIHCECLDHLREEAH